MGKIHNEYTLQSDLGQGGMAKVYLAEHKTLRQQVAIKVLNQEFMHNDNIRNRFLAEGRNMFRMSHPNIVKVTDLIAEDGMVAIVMEYMPGQSLKEYLDARGKLGDADIKKLIVQMLDALSYVHEQGLVHRDIKPSNFMISQKGTVKLLDFGIAKNTDTQSGEYTQTGTTQNMGTPMYMSPEQIKSTKDVTAQSDIYSLGVVLWQMVMGKKPYHTATLSAFDIQLKIVSENLEHTNTIWDAIIQKATSKQITNRYESSAYFLYGINQALLGNGKRNDAEETVVDHSFGKPKNQPETGGHLRIKIAITKNDSHRNAVKNIKYRKEIVCRDCKGNHSASCKSCNSTGRESVDELIAIMIPKGITNEHSITQPGKGNEGFYGGAAGDLVVKLQIENVNKSSTEALGFSIGNAMRRFWWVLLILIVIIALLQ